MQQYGITLMIENHYKDDFWLYPEFAQKWKYSACWSIKYSIQTLCKL